MILINYRLGLAIGENTSMGEYSLDPQISNAEWQFEYADWNRRRLKLLWVGISLNVLLLIAFKYLPIIWRWIFPQQSATAVHFAAPLGISFFTFECIAYLIDVYRGAPATEQFLRFATYKFFFAKLISGPITRYHTFAAQLQAPPRLTPDTIAEALWLIARGALKKRILADHLGIFVDICFGNLQRAGSTDLWLGIFAYGLQLYLDFSGYVDIARGTAMLFGLVLPENFRSPYFSTSIADFWRRWHITLGDWLRNYLYFPLGGSRRGLSRTCINLLIVMAIAGIWHGTALGYLIWGIYHGLALAVHRLIDDYTQRFRALKNFWHNPIGVAIAWLITQIMVFTSWIFFRLPNLKDSSVVIQHLWGYTADSQFSQKVYIEALSMSQHQISMLLLALASVMTFLYTFNRTLKLQMNWPFKLLLVPVCFYAIWLLAPEGSLPYIYFDF
jgi:alginate O-acetyltransferase complex protein AlgI